MNGNGNNQSPYLYLISLENRVKHKLIKRYDKPLSYHDAKMINDILYNEKTRYVEAFKEYLIYEDFNEFLKRFYKSYEINFKLPKILNFYEKYSKIYANYTVIPESKYMYKNIKRKQKMIDQMQNNDINSDYEEDEESKEDISNTVFSSKVINSIYKKTLTTLNKSENSKYTEQSMNDFLEKFNQIEKEINDKIINNFLKNKTPPKNIKITDKKKTENKIIDIQINHNHSKKLYQKNNLKIQNNLNHNANYKNNYNNLLFVNSYSCKTKNDIHTFKNNNSTGNYINVSNTFNNNTFNGYNYFKINTNFPKQKLPSALLKQSLIKNSNNKSEKLDNMSLQNFNNYFTNRNNLNSNQKYKLSLGDKPFHFDKLILLTNSSSSPKLLSENIFQNSSNKTNIFNHKKQLILKEKEIKEQKIKKELKNKIQCLSSHKIINPKKIKSNLLYHNYNSFNSNNNNMTYLSNKFIENFKSKNVFNKFNKKKNSSKYNENIIKNSNNNKKDKTKNNNKENIISVDNNSSKLYKKPESHRNYYYPRMLSGNNSSNKHNNKNINYKITVGLKQQAKPDKNKISFPGSPSNSTSNFYYQSQTNSRKSSTNNLNKKKKDKKKVVNNYNIVNNIHDNSTQINIYTGKDLYKSLFNSTNITPGNISPKSPINQIKENKNNKNDINNNINKQQFLKMNIKKEKPNKHILNLRKILNKQINDGEKAIISERLITNKKLIEKLGKYFFINKKDKNNNNNNINHNKKFTSKNKINNNIHKSINKQKNNEYEKLINKIIKSKIAKNKTNNNTPIKKRYLPCSTKNNIKAPNICLSSNDNELNKKTSKAIIKQNINYNKIISNLNDLKNFALDDNSKLIIHSERNKISKILFK